MRRPVAENAITVKMLNRNLTQSGEGPLLSCTGATVRRRLNAAGDFEATFPTRDERTFAVSPLATVLDFYDNGRFEFRGLVESIRYDTGQDGRTMVTFAGRGIEAELAEVAMTNLDLTNGSGAGITDAPNDILTEVNTRNGASWALDTTDGYSTTTGSVYGKLSGESGLTALIRIANYLNENFRFASDGTRKLVWLRTDTPDSGVRAIQGAVEPIAAEDNHWVCYVRSLTKAQDAYNVINRIYPYGGGEGDVRLTLAASTRSAPAGFTLSTANNYLQNDTSISDLGSIIRERHIEFKDIRPVSNSDTDLQSAANALYDAAYAYLTRTDDADDVTVYKLSVIGLPHSVDVGETVRVVYQDERYEIDADLVVLEIDKPLGQGENLAKLVVAEVAKPAQTDAGTLASTIERGEIVTAHPQIGQYTDTTTYREAIDDNNYAVLPFWLAEEVLQIDRVLLRFKVTPFSSMAGYYSGGDGNTMYTHTASTGITVDDHTSISTSSQSTNATSTDGAHSHQITAPSGTVANNLGLDSGNNLVNDDSAQHTFDTDNDAAHFHQMLHSHNIDDLTHTVNETAHRHTVLWGYVEEDGADTYAATDLEFSINGGAYTSAVSAITGAAGWYELEITSSTRDATTLRPSETAGYNYITVRPKTSSGKSCQIIAQIVATVRAQPLSSY